MFKVICKSKYIGIAKKERKRERKISEKKLETEKGPGLPDIKNYNATITKCGSDTSVSHQKILRELSIQKEIQAHMKSKYRMNVSI